MQKAATVADIQALRLIFAGQLKDAAKDHDIRPRTMEGLAVNLGEDGETVTVLAELPEKIVAVSFKIDPKLWNDRFKRFVETMFYGSGSLALAGRA